MLLLLLLVQKAPPFGFSAVAGPPAGPTPVVVATGPDVAGAVRSVRWADKEFIDRADHGRLLQSASGFDAGDPGPFNSECFNPTEAGSRADGNRPGSTSKLLHLVASGPDLLTVSRPAFWLRPGERSGAKPARNRGTVSDHLLTKRLTVGRPYSPHAILYRATFSVPPGEGHQFGQFEAVTGYMPADFSSFLQLLPTGQLAPLSDGPGEQPNPVVLATPDGRFAMGVWAPPHPGADGPGFGRFRFAAERVVKWNCVFRVRPAGGLPAADYPFRAVVAVGSRENVRATLVLARGTGGG